MKQYIIFVALNNSGIGQETDDEKMNLLQPKNLFEFPFNPSYFLVEYQLFMIKNMAHQVISRATLKSRTIVCSKPGE